MECASVDVSLNPTEKNIKREDSWWNEIFIKHFASVPGGMKKPCGMLKSLIFLSIVNADLNDCVKAEEVLAEILAKDDSSGFQVAQSRLRD